MLDQIAQQRKRNRGRDREGEGEGEGERERGLSLFLPKTLFDGARRLAVASSVYLCMIEAQVRVFKQYLKFNKFTDFRANKVRLRCRCLRRA